MHDAAAQDEEMPNRVVKRFSVFGVEIDPKSVAQSAQNNKSQSAWRKILGHWFDGNDGTPAHNGIKWKRYFLLR